VARNAIIGQLLGDGITAAEAGLIKEALLAFSLDNLLLLSEHDVKFHVKKLRDMPEDFGGYNIKEHFEKGHRQIVDDYVDDFIRTFDDLNEVNPRSMSYAEKERFLKEQVVKRDVFLSNDDRDFGLLCRVDCSNIDEIENISRTPGISVHLPGSGRRAVFLLRHRRTRGIVIHEAAHILDSIKHPALSAPTLPQTPPGQPGPWGSELDTALGAHYAWFLGECTAHPEKRWSHYATERNIRITEYLAEAVRMYAEKPELLKSGDPDMYHFARTFVEKGTYPSAGFPAHP
jgi:hypothetical protein